MVIGKIKKGYYLSAKFDKECMMRVFDDDDDTEIPLNELYEDELDMLLVYLDDLIEELENGKKENL